MLELAINAKKIHPNDWYKQRNVILSVIKEIIKTYPNCYQQKWLIKDKINLITFKFEDSFYFWWDGINGEVIECSGFERMIHQSINGEPRTELLWNSDPDDTEPMIPRWPIKFS